MFLRDLCLYQVQFLHCERINLVLATRGTTDELAEGDRRITLHNTLSESLSDDEPHGGDVQANGVSPISLGLLQHVSLELRIADFVQQHVAEMRDQMFLGTTIRAASGAADAKNRRERSMEFSA
jgi:hypothetical protein